MNAKQEHSWVIPDWWDHTYECTRCGERRGVCNGRLYVPGKPNTCAYSNQKPVVGPL